MGWRALCWRGQGEGGMSVSSGTVACLPPLSGRPVEPVAGGGALHSSGGRSRSEPSGNKQLMKDARMSRHEMLLCGTCLRRIRLTSPSYPPTELLAASPPSPFTPPPPSSSLLPDKEKARKKTRGEEARREERRDARPQCQTHLSALSQIMGAAARPRGTALC